MYLSTLKQPALKKMIDYPCKGLGMKNWTEFSNAVASIQIPNRAVKLIEKSSPTKIMVEIDTSKPFADVINKLSEIIKDVG